MSRKRDKSYWKSYRELKSNVNSHLAYIYSNTDHTDSTNNEQFRSDSEVSEENISVPKHVDLDNTSFVYDQRTTDVSEHHAENVLAGNASNRIDCLDYDPQVPDYMAFETVFDSGSNSFAVNDDTESSDNSSDDEFGEVSLEDQLASWGTKFNVSHSALSELLQILRRHHSYLPKDPRTLLSTKVVYNVIEIEGGSYHHFGLGSCLANILKDSSPVMLDDCNLLTIQINVDGLPLFKSSSTQFWPILGRLVGPITSDPFVIGLFVGDQKPGDVSSFLRNLISEMQQIHQNSLCVPELNKQVQVVISCIICDTPARAYVKQVKGHSGYFGCDKCTTKGSWKGKMTFPELEAPLRTDVQFSEMEDESHHIGLSPFKELDLGLVTQFPLDYMHLVCLGVMKRLLKIWMKGPLEKSCRIGANAVQQISEMLISFRKHVPHEFLRKGRSLLEIDRWKATELRLFLLYTGPVALRDCISRSKYEHFMFLFVGIYCLCSPLFCQTYCNYANEILRLFVQDFGRLYGDDMLVYNVHGLIHLAKDASTFGTLESFSAFPFESYLNKVKRFLRKPNFPLQQVIRRVSELKNLSKSSKSDIPSSGILQKKHTDGPILRHSSLMCQYKEIKRPEVFFASDKRDGCIIIDNKVAVIRNILSDDCDKYIMYEEFGQISDFFDLPLPSSDLRIFVVSEPTGVYKQAKLSEIIYKCVLLPYHGRFVCIPVLHTLHDFK